jgi:galactitol-specific phosphotransferase system IIB component
MVPMLRISTSTKKTDLITTQKRLEKSLDLQPKAETLNIILQFAANYKVEKITDNQYIEWFLN